MSKRLRIKQGEGSAVEELQDGRKVCGGSQGYSSSRDSWPKAWCPRGVFTQWWSTGCWLPPKPLHLLLGIFTRTPLSCLSKTWAVPHQGRNVFLPPFLFWCISLPYNLQRDHLACSNALLRKDCIVLPAFMLHRNVPLPERPRAWPARDKAEAAFLSLFCLAFAFLFPASFVRILICVYNKKWFLHLPFVT